MINDVIYPYPLGRGMSYLHACFLPDNLTKESRFSVQRGKTRVLTGDETMLQRRRRGAQSNEGVRDDEH